MVSEPKRAHVLYRKLLALYPRAFRERLAETMEQTFNDLYYERRWQNRRGFPGFVLWIFAETAIGIAREYWLLLSKGYVMKSMFLTLRPPALISLLLVVPFMIMELVNRRNTTYDFPFLLFVIMWLLPLLLLLTLMPILRNIRSGNGLLANPVVLLIRVVFLVLIAFAWLGLLADQMPCFLGVPNCD